MSRITPERLAEKIALSQKTAAMLPMIKNQVSEKTWCIIHDLVIGNQQNLQTLRAEREYAERECVWDIDEDMTMHLPGCGGASGLDVNYMKFCPYCGGKIVEKEDE